MRKIMCTMAAIGCLVMGMGSTAFGQEGLTAIEAYVRSIAPIGFTGFNISSNCPVSNEAFVELLLGNGDSSRIVTHYFVTSPYPIRATELRFASRRASVELAALAVAAIQSEFAEKLAQLDTRERSQAEAMISTIVTTVMLQNIRQELPIRASASHSDGIREWYLWSAFFSAEVPSAAVATELDDMLARSRSRGNQGGLASNQGGRTEPTQADAIFATVDNLLQADERLQNMWRRTDSLLD